MPKRVRAMYWIATLALCVLTSQMEAAAAEPSAASESPKGAAYQPPASPRATYNFNPGWKFIREDLPGADNPAFDDSAWTDVGLPHTWNDVDTYRALISHPGGDQTFYQGIGWYRKHFKLPADAEGKKILLEFEGLRQAARFFLNGQPVGLYENGITACGLDITALAKFGGQDNVLAVKVDNRTGYKEESTGTEFEWKNTNSNPNFGGLNRDAWLHVMGKVYQTLPLYENLKTKGVYVYGTDYDIKNKSATVNIESEARNDTAERATLALSAAVVDASGAVRAQFSGSSLELAAGTTGTLKAAGPLTDAHFWDVNDPYLYDVYSILSVNGKVADEVKIHTGFRKAEFKGGAGTGGVYLNDKFVWLTGYSQRASNDWPGLGSAYPDWMHDFNAALLRESNGNYVRWMHVSPTRADVAACDKFGIANVCPAGDGEHETFDRQWEQRMEVMRDSIIYFRNNPSILFWEAGNAAINAEHMQRMTALRKQLDPSGGRAMGCRSLRDPGAIEAAEYFGMMLGRPSSDPMRDQAPLIETEDFRDEAPRGIWDDDSPPSFGFKKGPKDSYDWNSETFALAGIRRYFNFVSNRIDNSDPAHSLYAAYASIYWSDSDADGRQQSSQVLRVSGKVDGVRLPKEIFYASRVMQSATPDLHILGHWTYPAGTKKTIDAIASHCDSVELFLNGKSLGINKTPENGYVYAFPDIEFAPGTLKAVASQEGKPVAEHELQTAGEPKAIKLTLHAGPQGLQADGCDVALIDFEVVDAQGRRCPTDEARVDFSVEGPVVWRGGFNAAKLDSTNNLFLNTECGINRVAIRSTTKPGTITVTAKRDGLTPATISIDAKPVDIKDGLALTGGLSSSQDAPQAPPAAATVFAAPVFSEDFESGELKKEIWDVRVNGGAAVSLQKDIVAHGKSALMVRYPAGVRGAYGFAVASHLPDALKQHFFGRAYVQFPKAPPNAHDVFITAGAAGWPASNFLEIGLRQRKAQLSLQQNTPNLPRGETMVAGPAYPVGKWFCLEWEFNDNPDAIAIWIDGEKAVDAKTPLKGVEANLVKGFVEFGFGFRSWGNAQEEFVACYDDIAFGTERIGPVK